MSQLKELFDPSLTFERRVEKVIKFSNREPHTLQQEASDYVVTDNLEQDYQKLLRRFEDAQCGTGDTDCCVWLSGFYGSGKSSFAKYFGLSFDPDCQIEGKRFFDFFKPRFGSPGLQQEFQTVINKYQCSVFLVDLAAQGNADNPNTPISTQLFDHVCRWANYPSDRKAGYLLSLLETDGRLDEFKEKVEESSGLTFDELIKERVLFLPTCSKFAHEFYPKIWDSPTAFRDTASISTLTDDEIVRQMISLIKTKTGSDRVLFVVDEVGHFLRNNEDLINNLDGFAKNLKQEGQGRAWLIATAQQTLPKTGPLFGLRDRFPIDPDLQASDIREITHKRLLKKSAAGSQQLEQLFNDHGERLLHATQLRDCDRYPKLDRKSFGEFHPLLPMHFEVLIEAISSLARLHGGIGLRSAIRCVEEILLSQTPDGTPLLETPAETLITAAELYDILKKDITATAREITLQVDNIARSATYGLDSLELRVAKALALLQQIEGFPTNRENIAALLHPRVDAAARNDAINAAIDRLVGDATIPIGETDGKLSYLSEEVAKVEQERANIPAADIERALIQNRILGEIFARPPKAVIENTKTVDSGVCVFDGAREHEIVGNDKDIRFVLRLVPASRLDDEKQTLIIESNARDNKGKIYMAAGIPGDLSAALKEIHQAEEIIKRQSNNTDPAVARYLTGQKQFAQNKAAEVRQLLSKAFLEGWFIYAGQAQAVETTDSDLFNACKKKLSAVAEVVFDQFKKAPQNVPQNVAEAFLKTNDLSQITRERDPLGLVQVQGTATEINLQHPALQAVIAFFDRHANPDGKRILTEFTRPPYGWSKETTRYLVAALFYAQKVKLLINGKEHPVIGEQSLKAFQNNTSFNGVTLKPNLEEVPEDIRRRSAERLSELTGETIVPLPQMIAKAAAKHLPTFQQEFQSLPYRLQDLGIDTERLERLQRSLNQALMSDGAEAIRLFGAESSEVFDDLQWARRIATSLDQGAENDLRRVAGLSGQVRQLQQQKLMPELVELWQDGSADLLLHIRNGSFVDNLQDIRQQLEDLEGQVAEHCRQQAEAATQRVQAQVDALLASTSFEQLDESAQEAFADEARRLVPRIEPTIEAILASQSGQIQALSELDSLRRRIEQAATPEPEPEPTPEPEPAPGSTWAALPRSLATAADLDQLIEQLQALRADLEAGKSVSLQFKQ